MGKKSKKHKRMFRPPLSTLDKSIYWLGLLLSFIGILLLGLCFEDITGVIAFQDPSVVAYSSHASFLFVLPLLGYVEISAAVFCITALEEKKPIFGNRKVRYGKEPWSKDCFPLFDARRKKIFVKPSEKRFRRSMTRVWCIGLLICLLLAPFSFWGRDCLTQNDSIISYNALNQATAYTTEAFSHLTIQAKYVSGYRTASYWKYQITIKTDGGFFTFSNRDFDWREPNSKERALQKMLEIKALFMPDEITIKGAHNIEKVADYLGLNDEQKQLLQKLFE